MMEYKRPISSWISCECRGSASYVACLWRWIWRLRIGFDIHPIVDEIVCHEFVTRQHNYVVF